MNTQINKQNNGQGFGVAGLVIGIIAVLLSFIPCFGGAAVLIGVTAIVFGSIALSRANVTQTPRGMGIAGLSLGSFAVLIGILWLVLIVGAKDHFKNHFSEFWQWTEHLDDSDINIDLDEDFDNKQSLEELEKALDELEGTSDDVKSNLNETIDSVHNEVKKAIQEAKDEIDDAKSK